MSISRRHIGCSFRARGDFAMPVYRPVRRIVVGIDFSELGDRALQGAIAMAAAAGQTEVHALYVRPGIEGAPMSARRFEHLDADLAELQMRVTQQLDVYRDAHGDPPIPEIAVHVRIGAPPTEIVALAAELQAGLVVLGTHGRKGVSRAVVGSVAETVVRNAGCPVLVMRGIKHRADAELHLR